VIFNSSDSPTVFKQFLTSGGQEVQADMSGMFLSVAASLYF